MRVYKPHSDAVINPMRDYPRNMPCICNSGKKWKVCCLPKQPMLVKIRKETPTLQNMVAKIKRDYKEMRKVKK